MVRDDEYLSRLTSVRTEMEASVLVGGLEARGIPAAMSGTYTTNFRTEAPGWVEVLVADEDLPRAQEALAEVRADHDAVDWSQVDVGEPEDFEDSAAGAAVPWWMGLKLWRRIAVTLIVASLVWAGVVFLTSTLAAIREPL
jgi:hypothetical protein